MVRPRCCRTIGHTPPCRRFRPLVEDGPGREAGRDAQAGEPHTAPVPPGQPPAGLEAAPEEVVLLADELEALRLADAEGLYHEEAASLMGVSRPTFGRVLTQARRKVAQALCRGLGIRIEAEVRSEERPGRSQAICPRCCRPLVPSHASRARKGVCPHCPKPAGPDSPSPA